MTKNVNKETVGLIDEFLAEIQKKKEERTFAGYHRVVPGEEYYAMITAVDFADEEEQKIRLTLQIFVEGFALERRFLYNMMSSGGAYYFEQILDLFGIEESLNELMGKICIIQIEQKGDYPTLVVIEEVTKDDLAEEISCYRKTTTSKSKRIVRALSKKNEETAMEDEEEDQKFLDDEEETNFDEEDFFMDNEE